MIRLVSGTGVITSPGDGIGETQGGDIIRKEGKNRSENECGRDESSHLENILEGRRQRAVDVVSEC